MKRVVLIETKSPHLHVYSEVPIPRLGSVLLGSILQDEGYQVDVFIEDIAPIDFDIVKRSDFVGISVLSSTSPRSYEIASTIRDMGIPVLLGGTHPTFAKEEAIQHADFLLRGEADETFLPFINAYFQNEDYCSTPGLSFWDGENANHNELGELPNCLSDNPIPDFRLVRGAKKMGVVSVSTSRGCPYDCSFCSVTTFNGKKYRALSVERVLQEIETHMRQQNLHYLFFCDDIFNWNRNRTKQILEGMIENKLTIRWGAQVRHEASHDPELMDLMRRSNCDRVYVGFESINQETLDLYNKRETKENIIDTITAFHRNKVKIHGMFVLGSDADDVETIRETTRFAQKYDIDSVQFMVLTPIPGSHDFEIFDQNKRPLLTRDWSLYDGHHVVHIPERMTPYELQVESMKAMKNFYTLKSAAWRLMKGDWFESLMRLRGFKVVRRWHKYNQFYIEELRKDLLQESPGWFPSMMRSLQGKRFAVSCTQSEHDLKPVIETFLQELGVNVVQSSDKFTAVLHDCWEAITASSKSAKQSIQKYFDKVKGEADVYLLLPERDEEYSQKHIKSASWEEKLQRIRSHIANVSHVPCVISLQALDAEAVRDFLTGIGLLLTDDLLKISQARQKAFETL